MTSRAVESGVSRPQWQADLWRDLHGAFERLNDDGIIKGEGAGHFKIHLVVLTEPYLHLVLEGRKTIESRFSKHRIAPYGVAQAGDWLALKQPAGPVIAVCRVAAVEFFKLDRAKLGSIRSRHGKALRVNDPSFWRLRQRSRYATLLHIEDVHRIAPLQCGKQDRRGWVVLL